MATTVSLKPNAVEISGSTSGTTTLQATAVAGTTTLTLPAATDTLVGKATTDTLTNKTLTGAAMNGTVGATTPSTGAFTTLSATGNVTVGNTTGERIVSIISTDNNSFYKVAPGNGATGGYRFNNSAGTQHWNIFETTGAAGQQGNLGIYNEVGAYTALTVDTSGNLLVGTTTLSNRLSVVATSGQYVARFGLNGTGSQSFINFVIGENTTPTGVGSITYNGTNTLYNALSDQRLKENIVDAGTALATLNQIKVRAFDWIESKTHETHGVVAQELKEVAPQCVTEGINNADGSIDRAWQVDTSPLVPMLIKAIQELTARITALEGA